MFVTGSSGREKLLASIARELKSRHNIDPYFLSLATGKTKIFFKEEGFDISKVQSITTKPPKDKIPNMVFLREKEDQYGFNLFDLWQIAAPRHKRLLKFTDAHVLSWMETVIKEIESYIHKVKPDYAILNTISAFTYVIAFRIFLQKGIPTMELMNARIPGRFTFDAKFNSEWPLVVNKYNGIKKNGLTESQRKRADNFVQNFRHKPVMPDNSTIVKETLSQRFYRYHGYGKTLLYRRNIPNLKPFIWYPIKDKFIKNSSRFEQPVPGEKYILYPLQTHPEASTSVRGKWYVNQIALIENISKSIPCDYKLYVKEHPRSISKRPKGYHKEIKKFPNIRLISPLSNTMDLIKNSDLIITVTGTPGWEAILHQKPVFTFGEVYYNIFDEVVKIKDYETLSSKIRQSLGVTIDYEKTLQFIAAMDAGTYNGIAALPNGCQNRSLKHTNIIKLVDGVEKYIEKIC